MIQDRLLVAAIFAASIEASEDHPNELKFKGVLCRLGEPSTKAPNGSQGHKILIPKALAEKRYKTLLGMGVNYHSDLDKHNPTKKVGVIKKAWIEGNAIMVSGIIWKKDFPDAERDLKQSDLGMSFEASNIDVKDAKADVWELSDLCFTGAAILYKDSAAYFKTSALAASASMSAQLITKNNGGETMANEVKKKKIAASGAGNTLTAEALVAAMTAANKPIIDGLNALVVSQTNLQQTILANAAADVEAKAKKAMKKDDDDEDMDDDDDDDEGDDDEEASADMEEEASADDEDELEDLSEEDNDDENEEPGHINKEVEDGLGNKGDKTTVTTKGDKHKSVKAGADLASLRRTVAQLVASKEDDQRQIKALNKKLQKQTLALEAAGDRTERRSISLSAGAQALLAKEGLAAGDMAASGQKLSVSEFDIAAQNSNLSIQQKIAFKTELARAGIMDEGVVRRATVN